MEFVWIYVQLNRSSAQIKVFRKKIDTFFGFCHTKPENVSKDTIAIIGSLCVSKSIHRTLGQERATKVLRKLSKEFCTHNLRAEVSLEDHDIVDLGDFRGDKLAQVVDKVLKRNAKVLIIGGDHTTTFHALKNADKIDLTVFDAHLDSEECKERIHHACIIRELLKRDKISRITLIGMRGYSTLRSEIEFLKKHRVLAWPTSKEVIETFLKTSNYISIDLDFLNPSSFWAVRAPEPLGFDINSFISIINETERTSARYVDMVEYSPDADPGYVCGKMLLQLMLEILSLLVRS